MFSLQTLGSFFTRKLKTGLRPLDNDSCVVSPADGTVTHMSRFRGGYLEQVKGVHYSLSYFLGLDKADASSPHRTTVHAAAPFPERSSGGLLHATDGSTVLMQMVIYLSPGDYHRFHSPADWTVETKRYYDFQPFKLEVKQN